MSHKVVPVGITDDLLEVEAVTHRRHEVALEQDRVQGQRGDVGETKVSAPVGRLEPDDVKKISRRRVQVTAQEV